MRVWVVEDNDANFELVEFLLVEAGWTPLRARDAGDFERLIEGEPPDLVLLDVHLPDASGLDLLAELRRRPAFDAVPVVALTAHAMRGDRERFLAAGCDGYIPKPFVTSSFLSELEAAMRRKGESRR